MCKPLLPEIIVYAGPNGSGKSTITRLSKTIGAYINADDIKRVNLCSDIEAAQIAESMREDALANKRDFTFETVLSTDRNLKLLQRAKKQGFFIRCIYVLTANPDINVARVHIREAQGGHGVPDDKIYSRYNKAIALIPELINTCDVLHLYDNTVKPYRIFKKRKDQFFYWENDFWNIEQIQKLTGISDFE